MLKYHFQAREGWINDPNGFSYFEDKYHLYFQYNPYDVVWDTMHWGHAVSTDLLTWEELPIAMYPDQPYENGGGCFSGSGIVKDGKPYFFYTAVNKEGLQQQCRGFYDGSDKIQKDPSNPIIANCIDGDPKEFRDPKVNYFDGAYYMALGTGLHHEGRVVLYKSYDLESWEYIGIILRDTSYGDVIECPDFFKMGDKYVLGVSYFEGPVFVTAMYVGDFDGVHYTNVEEFIIEKTQRFYAPQTMEKDGRRIMIGWLREIYKEGAKQAGAMSIPREITYVDGVLRSYPVAEAQHLLKDSDAAFDVKESALYLNGAPVFEGDIREIAFLRDGELVEVFINRGEANYVFYPV